MTKMHARVTGKSWVAAAALAAILLSGCATHPKPTPMAATSPPPPPPPAPTYTAPAPTQPVQSGILPGTVQDFVVNVGDRIYFDYDKFDIRPDGARVLEAQAAWLNRYPAVRVRIEGNCDERGTQEYNFALGAKRASEVRRFLSGHGVDPGRITTVSYGKEKPIDPGTGETAWQHNRNAHTAIIEGAR